MNAEILSIGNEILSGDISNTNAQWIARELQKISIQVTRITSLMDDKNQICETLYWGQRDANIIISTGGLGITNDDVTREAICKFFDSDLIHSKAVWDNMKVTLDRKKMKREEYMYDQAKVPHNCTVILNKIGTAPSFWFNRNDTKFVFLPGVPEEMKEMMKSNILPRLSNFNGIKIKRFTITTKGVTEAELSTRLRYQYEKFPPNVDIGFLLFRDRVEIKITISAKDSWDINVQFKNIMRDIEKEIGTYIYTIDHN